MFSAFFGHYLLNQGIVNASTLSRLLENQDKVRAKLGILAMNSGYMTATQVERIHHLQHIQDLRFGELAVQEGFLTENQVNELLSQQKAEHLVLAQSLIDDNIMDYQTFEIELEGYKHAHSLSDEQFEAIKSGNIDIIVKAFTAFETKEESSFYTNYISLFVKNLIRFVDSNVRLDRVEKIDRIAYSRLFTQSIEGDRHLFSAFTGTEAALLALASKHAEAEFNELDDYAIDSCSEFLNLHNGLFIVNETSTGIDLSLTIQEYQENVSILPEGNFYKVPIYLTHGTLYVLLGK